MVPLGRGRCAPRLPAGVSEDENKPATRWLFCCPKPMAKNPAPDTPSGKQARKSPVRKALTAAQEAYAQARAQGMQIVDAFVEAKPHAAKWSRQSQHANAAKFENAEKVRERVKELLRPAMKRLDVSIERTLNEAARLAFFDARKLFDKDGKPLPITDLDDDTAAAIAGMEVLEQYEGSGQDRVFVGYLKKYKLADKNSAIEKLMKHLGMFAKDNAQKPAQSVEVAVFNALIQDSQSVQAVRKALSELCQ